VAPVLLALATSTAGTQRLTLRLEPADLGTVQVRIDRAGDAPAHVEISVSRPETLTMILRDQVELRHTLDQAGVPAEGRTLTFHLAGQNADTSSRQPGGFGQPTTNGQTTRSGTPTHDEADPEDAASLPSTGPMRWQRVGLDITA
jgi:flagellar hook-length control protein FliK